MVNMEVLFLRMVLFAGLYEGCQTYRSLEFRTILYTMGMVEATIRNVQLKGGGIHICMILVPKFPDNLLHGRNTRISRNARAQGTACRTPISKP